MREILSIVMTVLTIGWCIYGFVVWRRWDKAGQKADKMMDELKKEMESEPCALCGSKWIDIEVRTVSPDDMYVFSTNETIGLMYCPMCGRKLEGGGADA